MMIWHYRQISLLRLSCRCVLFAITTFGKSRRFTRLNLETPVISITDGLIFFSADLYLRYWINERLIPIGTSAISGVRSASDLDQTTLNQLARGQRLRELLKQSQSDPEEEIAYIDTGANGYLDSIEGKQLLLRNEREKRRARA